MNSIYLVFSIVLMSVSLGALTSHTYGADETFVLSDRIINRPTLERFTNENWFSIPHPRVRTFTMHADGSSEGFTETGVRFVQYNVPNVANIRVQRFEIEDHYHYIIDGEIIETFEEFSIRLAQAHSSRSTSSS